MAERNWREDWELTKRATPGPWEYFQGDLIGANGKGLQCFTKIFPREWGPFWCNQNDPEFIAEAREALPYWLQRVRELEARLAETQEVLRKIINSRPLHFGLDYVEMRVPRAALEDARKLLRGIGTDAASLD